MEVLLNIASAFHLVAVSTSNSKGLNYFLPIGLADNRLQRDGAKNSDRQQISEQLDESLTIYR